MWKVDKLIVSNYPFTYCRLQIGMVERIKSFWLFKQASAFIIELKHHIYLCTCTHCNYVNLICVLPNNLRLCENLGRQKHDYDGGR